ncbi:MAG: type II restriction endonuclease [Anaerovoracaceae bacterium]
MVNKRNFEDWLATFIESIADYEYYVDFKKVFENVDKIKVEMNILNSLVGSNDIERDFKVLVSKYPEVTRCLPLLLAKRELEITATEAGVQETYFFAGKDRSGVEELTFFMRKSGLFELISERIISNLFDYITGVEAGLSSNGRKNRGGHLMENTVETFIKELSPIEYYKELKLSEIQKKWGIDLSAISNDGRAEKRFDFVVKTENCIYAIETNFYSGGGSKLNETARSYKMIAQEASDIDGFKFVWFTDGIGWKSAKNNLQETFEMMEHIYNIEDMKNGIMRKIFV